MHNSLDDFQLKLYPPSRDKLRKAYDHADQLLIDAVETFLATQEKKNLSILIVNDMFGALPCFLCSAHIISVLNDSYLSQKALQQNLTLNQLSQDSVSWITEDKLTKIQPDLVLFRLSKNFNFLTMQLKILQFYFADTPILFGVMQKQVNDSIRQIIDNAVYSKEVGRAERKARVIFGRLKLNTDNIIKTFAHYNLEFDSQVLTIANLPNVFSATKLDIGTRFFVENFPRLEQIESIADIGCGNGLLSCVASVYYPKATIVAFDESHHAIASTRESARINDLSNIVTILSDGMENSPKRHYDLILCNPPFHHGISTELDSAKRMFRDAEKHLSESGCFYVVANRHLPYQKMLNKLFSTVIRVAENHKFIIYTCSKR